MARGAPLVHTPRMLSRFLLASVLYFALIFGLGFLFGAVRIMFLAPRYGGETAVLIELPIMIAASFAVAFWLSRAFNIRPWIARLLMGLIAFALLLSAELALGMSEGMSPQEWLALTTQAPGLWGLLAQCVFAICPALVPMRAQGSGR
jgi:hypothetical protein